MRAVTRQVRRSIVLAGFSQVFQALEDQLRIRNTNLTDLDRGCAHGLYDDDRSEHNTNPEHLLNCHLLDLAIILDCASLQNHSRPYQAQHHVTDSLAPELQHQTVVCKHRPEAPTPLPATTGHFLLPTYPE